MKDSQMPNYTIEAHGDARELYSVEAATEDEAREKFERGDVQPAYLTEVSGATIYSIEEDDA